MYGISQILFVLLHALALVAWNYPNPIFNFLFTLLFSALLPLFNVLMSIQSDTNSNHMWRSFTNSNHMWWSFTNSNHMWRSFTNSNHMWRSFTNSNHMWWSFTNSNHMWRSFTNSNHMWRSFTYSNHMWWSFTLNRIEGRTWQYYDNSSLYVPSFHS